MTGYPRCMASSMNKNSKTLVRPVRVEALEGYRIWIEFEDGVQGVADLSGYAGRGVWKAWEDRSLFESVKITPYRALGWGEDDVLDMCADWAYMQVTDTTVDDTREQLAHV